MSAEIPILCNLSNDELQNRRKNILQRIGHSVIGFEELENGFSYRFPSTNSVLQELTDLIKLERECCPFLNFKLFVEAGKDSLSLELTGSEGTKETLRSLFNWNRI